VDYAYNHGEAFLQYTVAVYAICACDADLDFNELYEVLRECYALYINYMTEMSKNKVEAAFRALKLKEGGGVGQSDFQNYKLK
jgi:hypothetical protein